MKFFEARETIHARPERIWQILTDVPRMTTWDSGIESLVGSIELGGELELKAAVAPGRVFKLVVDEFEPPKHMVWKGGAPFGLFTGRRSCTLTPQGDTTDFHLREEFTGPLLPLIWRSMPDLGPSFQQFAAGLRAEAER